MLFGDENPDYEDREVDQDIDNVLNGTAEDSFPLPGCPDRDISHAAEVAATMLAAFQVPSSAPTQIGRLANHLIQFN